MSAYTLVASGYGKKQEGTIGRYEVNKEGKVVQKKLYSGYENPSFLVQANDKLVMIQEKGDEAIVSIHNINETELELLDTITLPGTDLCHIAYVKSCSMLLGACYGTGHVFAIKVEKDGKLDVLSFVKQEANQEGVSRAHCMVPSPKEDYAYGVNIASDQIVCYKLDEKGIIVNEGFPYLQLPLGEGPRHMKWHPTLEVAYVITEYSNRIFVLQGGKEDGSLEVVQTIELLKEQKGESYGATLCINKEGTMLYGANRGMDTITQLSIKEDGKLVYIEETSVYGCWPRHIALTQDEQYLLIANQKSGEVNIVEVDTKSGKLGKVIEEIGFPQVSFVEEVIN